MPKAFHDSSLPYARCNSAKAVSTFPADAMRKLYAAYQRDGRLAAAATARQDNPGLSLPDALYLIDHALGLRKAPSHI